MTRLPCGCIARRNGNHRICDEHQAEITAQYQWYHHEHAKLRDQLAERVATIFHKLEQEASDAE